MSKPKSLRRIRFTVRGDGIFPFDMLRYDNCFPATPEDIEWIGPCGSPSASIEHRKGDEILERCGIKVGPYKMDLRELMLETYLMPYHGSHVIKDRLVPAIDRWLSFGWQVTEVYPMERIPLDQINKNRLPKEYQTK